MCDVIRILKLDIRKISNFLDVSKDLASPKGSREKACLKENKCYNMMFGFVMLTPLSNADLSHSVQVFASLGVKKKSTKSLSNNKWTK